MAIIMCQNVHTSPGMATKPLHWCLSHTNTFFPLIKANHSDIDDPNFELSYDFTHSFVPNSGQYNCVAMETV